MAAADTSQESLPGPRRWRARLHRGAFWGAATVFIAYGVYHWIGIASIAMQFGFIRLPGGSHPDANFHVHSISIDLLGVVFTGPWAWVVLLLIGLVPVLLGVALIATEATCHRRSWSALGAIEAGDENENEGDGKRQP